MLFFSHFSPQRHKQKNTHQHSAAVRNRSCPRDSVSAGKRIQKEHKRHIQTTFSQHGKHQRLSFLSHRLKDRNNDRRERPRNADDPLKHTAVLHSLCIIDERPYQGVAQVNSNFIQSLLCYSIIHFLTIHWKFLHIFSLLASWLASCINLVNYPVFIKVHIIML